MHDATPVPCLSIYINRSRSASSSSRSCAVLTPAPSFGLWGWRAVNGLLSPIRSPAAVHERYVASGLTSSALPPACPSAGLPLCRCNDANGMGPQGLPRRVSGQERVRCRHPPSGSDTVPGAQ